MLPSQTSTYALRAVLYLVREGSHRPLRVGEIAEAVDIPRNYLSKILHQLARAGVLTSSRGPKGGFELARPAAEVSLAHVIEPLEPVSAERPCLLGNTACSDESPCAAHHRWKHVADQMQAFFHDTTIAELLRREPRPTRKGVKK